MNAHPPDPNFSIHRRRFLERAACGFGGVALQAMLADVAAAATSPLASRAPHFAPRAQRVIFLFMAGGPSQLDLFVPKPRLVRDHGKRVGVTNLPRGIPVGTEKFLTFGPAAEISPRGESGAMISSLLPHLAKVTDELCFLHGMQVDNPAWGRLIAEDELLADWNESQKSVGDTLDFLMYRLSSVSSEPLNPSFDSWDRLLVDESGFMIDRVGTCAIEYSAMLILQQAESSGDTRGFSSFATPLLSQSPPRL